LISLGSRRGMKYQHRFSFQIQKVERITRMKP
jgi:hypothetical protein